MSKSFLSQTGLGLLGIPAGLMLILAIVFALFLGARDTASPHNLPTGSYHAADVH